MKLVTFEMMRQIDRAAIGGTVSGCEPIPGLELMERAGRGVADAIWEDFFLDAEKKRVAVFCGPGANGGDGFVVARCLAEHGCFVTVFVCAEPSKIKGDARQSFDRLAESDIKTVVIKEAADLPERVSADLLIDALLGSGASGPPKGLIKAAVRLINDLPVAVAAIDNPTGLNADTGEPADETVWADFTYSIAAPKRGHYLRSGKDLAGVTQVVDIGIPEAVFDHFDIHEHLITPETVAELLPQRPVEGHKGTFGRLFLLVGSRGLTGAGSLAAQAALRSGVGVATIGCPADLESIYETSLTEVMSRGLPCVGHKGALATRALGAALSALNGMNAGVIGPGLGLHRETMELVRRLIARVRVPFTLDADALTACSKDLASLEVTHHDCVLTPHAGEFQRLTGESVADGIEERLGQVRAAAKRFNAVVVLKGATTLICDPQGEVFVSPLGNSGMATAGSGDVLSGLIGSFLAQGLSVRDAAIVGVYLHSLAGDIAAAEIGERSLIAGDLIEYLSRAFELVEE